MTPEKPSHVENLNPNVSNRSPLQKSSHKNNNNNSPIVVDAVKVVVRSPQNRIRQRKFLVAKKKKNNENNKNPKKKTVSCTCKHSDDDSNKCVCEAYQNLRASQEGFFIKDKTFDEEEKEEEEEEKAERNLEEVIEANLMIHDIGNEERKTVEEEEKEEEEEGCVSFTSMVKRRRERLLEEARNSVPESGKVMHLVKAFERLLSIPNSSKEKEEKKGEEGECCEEENEKKNKVKKWALPGLQLEKPHKENETEVSGSDSLFCCTLTSENLGLDKRVSVSSSWDSNRASVSSRTSSGGRRSRRNSLESSVTLGGRRWKKKQQLKVTSQKPFKLRTEQRGKLKEEEFMKKVQEMLTEQERLRVPIAQGLPWTTDEPQCLPKPPVKESTKPIDLKLHSDFRAIDRAEFDQQVAEKLSLLEQQKMEMERQQKLAEEEEIRRLRKELIPKAQPMPYFDRPFVPRRSMKHPTIPREPKFHIPHHKKIKCLSWNEMRSYSSYFNSQLDS